MVAPVTGPINKTDVRLGSPNVYGYRPTIFYRTSSGYRQKPPYNLNLSYDMTQYTAICQSTDPSDYGEANWSAEDHISSKVNKAMTQAYDRYRDSAYNTSSLGVTLGERKQAIGMMQGRLIGLYRFSRSLRKLKFNQAWKDLGLTPPQKGWRPTSKHYGGMWLEYHLGWKPLVNDISSTMEVLDSPFPYGVIRGSGKQSHSTSVVVQKTDIPTNYTFWTVKTSSSIQLKYGAFIEVTNPNLHAANALGLINPLSLAWELVPFSFIVDWFTGIGNWLESFTDFVGCRIVNPWSLRIVKGVENDHYFAINKSFVQNPPAIGGGYWLAEPRTRIIQKTYTKMGRGQSTPSLPRPTFTLPDRLSVTRGATAVSLLLQQLKR